MTSVMKVGIALVSDDTNKSSANYSCLYSSEASGGS